MKPGPFQIVSNASMAAGFTSSAIDLQQVWIYSIQANWSGPTVGEFKLQISNDLTPLFPAQDVPYFAPVNWSNYSGSASSATAVAGSSNFMWNVVYNGYRWVRLVYTSSSGGGTLNAFVCTKG